MSSQMTTDAGPMAVLCVAVIIGVCVFILNPLTFTAILRTPSLRRNHSNFFLLNLGLVDMLLMVCIITFKTYMIQTDKQTQAVCVTSIVVFGTISMASMLSSFAIAVDRFLFIHKALTYSTIVTAARTVLAIVSIWTLSLINGLIPLFGGIKGADACHHPSNSSICIQGIFIVTLFLATGLISTGLYSKLFFIIRRHNLFLEQHAMSHSRTHDCRKQACTIESQLGACHLSRNSHVSSFCSTSTRSDTDHRTPGGDMVDTDHVTPGSDMMDTDHMTPGSDMLDTDPMTPGSDMMDTDHMTPGRDRMDTDKNSKDNLLKASLSERNIAMIASDTQIEFKSNVSFSLFADKISTKTMYNRETEHNSQTSHHMGSQISPQKDVVSEISPKQDMDSQISPKQDMDSQISPKQDMGSPISPKQDMGSQISPKQDMDSQISPKQDMDSKISPKQDMGSQISPNKDVCSQMSSQVEVCCSLSPHQNDDSDQSLNDKIHMFSSKTNSCKHVKKSSKGRVVPFQTNSRYHLCHKTTQKHQAKRRKKVCFLKCQHLRDLRTIKTMILMFGIYFICWTPIMCCKFVHHVFMMEIDGKWLTVAWIVGASNSLWNFAVYPLRKVELRRAIIKLLSSCLRCPWQSGTAHSSSHFKHVASTSSRTN